MRIIIAGILGGIVMFVWSFLSHEVFQIGDSGVKMLPNEAAVVACLKTNVSDPGFYLIPGMDMAHATEADQAAWLEKYKAGPNAILIYHPTGQVGMMKMLGIELASNVVACWLVAFILAMGIPSFIKKVIAATLIGFVGWVSILVSYWNWYRYPDQVVLAELCDQVIGWFLAGIVLALIVRARPTAASMD
jgi:hypothetical protein